jgi:uncharacterized protein
VSVFEWDEEKKEQNLTKHGLSFEDAEMVFEGPCLTFEDTRFEYEEERFISIGYLEGRMVVIAHTPRGEKTRLISMRKANSREQKNYQKRFEASRRHRR